MYPKLKRPIAIYFAVMIGLGFVAGIAGVFVGYMSAAHPDIAARLADYQVLALAVIGTLAMVFAMWTSVRWMRTIDEAAQEAHKSSWYWGGSIGMCIGMVLVLIATAPSTANWRVPSFFYDRTDPVAYVAMGGLGMLLLMILGYIIAWAWWWKSRQ